MATSLYEVTLDQRFNGQQVLNKFNYVGSGTPAAVSMSFALISAMGFIDEATVFPPGVFSSIRDMQSADLSYVEVVARDVYSLTDFYSRPFTGLGGNVASTSGNEPSFVSYAFRTNRVRADIRRGQRRFAGVVEGGVDSYGLLTSGNLALGEDLAELMSDTLTYDDEGNTLTFVPCVVSKEPYTVEGSGKTAYRYYATFAEQDDHIASGVAWEVLEAITTQNSRKVGRGS